MKLLRNIGASALVMLGVAACDSATTLGVSDGTETPGVSDSATGNIVQTAVDAGSFTKLAEALTTTGLDAVLADETRSFTVFAPTDAAFDELGDEAYAQLLTDPETLSDILLYHVLADQNVGSAAAISLAGSSVTAANQDDLQLSLSDDKLFINNAEVITPDVLATNGTIHVINKVLLPPADNDTQEPAEELGNIVDVALAAGSFNTLAAALEAADLVSVLADENATFTVFAPTDDAFAALGQAKIDELLADPDTLRDILLYHVIQGQAVNAETAIGLAGSSVTMANTDEVAVSLDMGNLFVNQSQVITPDVMASNGIIHVIDAVMLPPADVTPEPELLSIYDTAIAAGNFQTLVTTLQVTGLDGPLAGNHETYTVFAPTDDAFAALGQDTIDALVADPDTLRNILLYHVIADAAVDSGSALSLVGSSVEMANGDSVQLSLKDGELYINDARVIATDIQATNGVIHVLDAVLLPH